MTCKPEHRYILLPGGYRIEVILDDQGQQRYIPQVWIADPSSEYAGTDWEDGAWESLLPDGYSRQMLRDARNDCARNAGKEIVE